MKINFKNALSIGKHLIMQNGSEIAKSISLETLQHLRENTPNQTKYQKIKNIGNTTIKIGGHVIKNHADTVMHNIISSTPITKVAGITMSAILDHTLNTDKVSGLVSKISKNEDLSQKIADATYKVVHGRERGDLKGKYFITEAVCGLVVASAFALFKKNKK